MLLSSLEHGDFIKSIMFFRKPDKSNTMTLENPTLIPQTVLKVIEMANRTEGTYFMHFELLYLRRYRLVLTGP